MGELQSPSPVDRDETRSSLLRRIRTMDDDDAWQQFWDTYRGFVRRIAFAGGLNDHEADEVGQEVLLRVAAKIHEFDRGPNQGSFRKWLATLTRWRMEDFRRRKERRDWEVLVGDKTDKWLAHFPAPVIAITSEIESLCRWKLVWLALRQLRHLDPTVMQIYGLYVLEGWPTKKIAKILNTSRTRIYSVKARVTRQIHERVTSVQRRLLRGDEWMSAQLEAQGSSTPSWFRRMLKLGSSRFRQVSPS